MFEQFINGPLAQKKKMTIELMSSIPRDPRRNIPPPYDKTLDEICAAIDREKPIVVFDCQPAGRRMKQFLNVDLISIAIAPLIINMRVELSIH